MLPHPDSADREKIHAETLVPVSSIRTLTVWSLLTSNPDNANKSSTYKYLNSDFNISYADQSGAAGDYATDVLQFGAAMIQNLQFGIGYESSSAQSVLGIGYPDHEAQVILGTGSQYQNLPSIMVQNKLIQSEAYSLWLNDLDANTGSILFGGVDTEKYHGNLATLPIQLDPGSSSPEEFFITLTGITLGNQAIGGSLTEAVLLDSGSSLMYLPNDLASDLYNSVGAQYVESQGVAAVPCSMGTNHTALNFTFSGPVISVPMSELVIPGGSAGSSVFGEDASQEACTFGVLPAGDSNSVLGDPFLRSAYVVYDLSNNQISLAQTDFNSSTSNVMEIGTGKQAVPNASGVPNAATAQPGQTGGGRIGSPTSAAPTATSTSTSKPKGAASSSADVPVRVLGGIVGAAMVLLLAL